MKIFPRSYFSLPFGVGPRAVSFAVALECASLLRAAVDESGDLIVQAHAILVV